MSNIEPIKTLEESIQRAVKYWTAEDDIVRETTNIVPVVRLQIFLNEDIFTQPQQLQPFSDTIQQFLESKSLVVRSGGYGRLSEGIMLLFTIETTTEQLQAKLSALLPSKLVNEEE